MKLIQWYFEVQKNTGNKVPCSHLGDYQYCLISSSSLSLPYFWKDNVDNNDSQKQIPSPRKTLFVMIKEKKNVPRGKTSEPQKKHCCSPLQLMESSCSFNQQLSANLHFLKLNQEYTWFPSTLGSTIAFFSQWNEMCPQTAGGRVS